VTGIVLQFAENDGVFPACRQSFEVVVIMLADITSRRRTCSAAAEALEMQCIGFVGGQQQNVWYGMSEGL